MTDNAYDDDDFDAIVSELDTETKKLDDAKEAKKKADKLIKARGKELGIPLRALNPALKARRQFRQLLKTGEEVDDDHREVHLDMFKRMIGGLVDTPLGAAAVAAFERGVDGSFAAARDEPAAKPKRTRKAKAAPAAPEPPWPDDAAAKANSAAEQVEGKTALDAVGTKPLHDVVGFDDAR